jgi:YVTN family beta-propeller protein
VAGPLDCRGKAVPEAGRAIIDRYNAAHPGSRFDARVDGYGAGLRMWLLEAGARHTATAEGDGTWRLAIERGRSPAQGSIPGVHHLLAGRQGSVWTCERARRVARIDADELRVVCTATVARKASHLALHERADRLFVADAEAGEMIALRASDLAEIQRWPAPGMPQLPVVNDDGLVCVTGAATGTITIAWPGGEGYRSGTFDVGPCPHDPLLTADGQCVFVPCAGSGELVKMRLASGEILGRVAVGDGPAHLALAADGTRVYAANSWDGTMTCVTTDGERAGSAYSGRWAHAIEVTPDGRWVYVANFMDDTVAVFDAATLARVALLAADAYPHGLDISADGRFAVVTGFGSSHVRLIDAQLHRELARIETGAGSSHTAFQGGCAFVCCSVSDRMVRIDLEDCATTGMIRMPSLA